MTFLLLDEIGIAYAKNRRKYPDYLLMNRDTYIAIMTLQVFPEGFDPHSLNCDRRTILGIRVLFEEDLNTGDVQFLYCKKEIKGEMRNVKRKGLQKRV